MCFSLKKNWNKLLWKLNEKDITDKNFWKNVKPFLSDKSVNSDKIHPNEVLNEFFSNIAKNLKIPEYENFNHNFENVKDPVLKANLKYKNHPNIIARKEKSKNWKFTFHEVDNEKIIKGLRG